MIVERFKNEKEKYDTDDPDPDPPKKQRPRGTLMFPHRWVFLIVAIISIVLILLGGGWYYYTTHRGAGPVGLMMTIEIMNSDGLVDWLKSSEKCDDQAGFTGLRRQIGMSNHGTDTK